jgi:peptide deformylase
MAIRNIVKEGDPVLRKTARSVLAFDDKLAMLIDDMLDTMYEAEGVGLAAPQVGILRRICVIDIGEGPIELVNPVIEREEGIQLEAEGCLSLPGQSGITKRPMKVTVRAQNRKGESYRISGEGLLARAFCHEIDHLNGILYKDRLADKK